MKHNLLLGVDDKGHLSCHKINLYFIYFNLSQCVQFLNDLLVTPVSGNASSRTNGHLPPIDITNIDIEDGDVIITGPSSLFRSSLGPEGQSRSSFGPEGQFGLEGQSRAAQQSTVVQSSGTSTVETLTPAQPQTTAQTRTLSMSASKRTQRLIGHYSQRWVKEFVRKRLDLNLPLHYEVTPSGRTLDPRHCASSRCPCQFIEEHLRFKPLTKFGWKDLCL